MNEELNILTKLTPVPLLVIALGVIGKGLKMSFVSNRLIPILLPLIGAIVYPFIGDMIPIPGIDKLEYPFVFYGLIGLVCGGVAVWGHQVLRQMITNGGSQ